MKEENELSRFLLLPEGCISEIISKTSPRDACRAASISWGIKSAADSDTVWERFLPPDYRNILSRSSSPVAYSTKKQLYFGLCNSPILLDDGKMSFGINKCNGKKCYVLAGRELYIAWKDNPSYWKWESLPESRFAKVAELIGVCWLDIRGKIPTKLLSPNTTYAAYLVFKQSQDSRGLEVSAKASVRRINSSIIIAAENSEDDDDAGGPSDEETRTVYLKQPTYRVDHVRRGIRRGRSRNFSRQVEGQVPKERIDGWMEIELGTILINDEEDDDEGVVEMRCMEIEHLNWKSGLTVEGFELRPHDQD